MNRHCYPTKMNERFYTNQDFKISEVWLSLTKSVFLNRLQSMLMQFHHVVVWLLFQERNLLRSLVNFVKPPGHQDKVTASNRVWLLQRHVKHELPLKNDWKIGAFTFLRCILKNFIFWESFSYEKKKSIISFKETHYLTKL